MHRLPRLHHRVQGRARHSGRRQSLLGENRREAERFPTPGASSSRSSATSAMRRPAPGFARPTRSSSGATASSICTATRASAAAPAWWPVPTTSCSSIPNTHTAEKCNFCANRVENELLPACVSVCPTECRIFGDLDDPSSAVAQIAAREATSVRKPEKGTIPKVFYIDATAAAMQPEIATRPFVYKEGQVFLRPLGSPEADPRPPRRSARGLRHPARQALGHRHGGVPAHERYRDRRHARLPAAGLDSATRRR